LYIKHCSAVRDRLLQQKSELTQALSHIHSLAIRDELTQLPNRLHMRELLEHESHRHRREGQTLCLAMLDLDLFKRINDRYGHQTGDEVLRQFASNASAVLRVTDVLARWGGEEFFLFMPNTSPQAALQVLERMRGRIANLHFPAIDPTLQLTFSGGLTVLGPDEQIELAIKRADSALYQVKANGRNAVRLFENDAFDRINMT
jgi:diguanylate cyclase (GGDEF)-like protein